MKHSEFSLGLEFWMSGAKWRCTDVGTRAVVAIKLDLAQDPSWHTGPPYAVAEMVIDEYDQPACSLEAPPAEEREGQVHSPLDALRQLHAQVESLAAKRAR